MNALRKPKRLKLTQPMADEASECVWLIEWRDKVGAHHYPELKLLYHIPNGGYRVPWTALQLKRQGVRAGMPDFHLPVGRGAFLSLYVEMKRDDGGTVSAEQYQVHGELRQAGNKVEICCGWQKAAACIEGYLQLDRRAKSYVLDD